VNVCAHDAYKLARARARKVLTEAVSA